MVNEYLAYLKDMGRSEHTVRSYRAAIRDLEKYLGYKIDSSADVDTPTLMRYQAHLSGKMKKSSVNTRFLAIKAFFTWLEDMGIIEKSPDMSKVKQLKVNKKFVRVLSELEIQKIFESPDIRLQYRLMARLFLETGLRAAEMARIKVRDIVRGENGNCHIRIVEGKGGKNAMLPLLPETCEMVSKYLSLKTDVDSEDYLMSPSGAKKLGKSPISSVSIYNRVKYIGDVIGADDITPHTFRRTFISRLANSPNVALVQASHLARHSNVSTTMRYVRVDEAAAELALIRELS